MESAVELLVGLALGPRGSVRPSPDLSGSASGRPSAPAHAARSSSPAATRRSAGSARKGFLTLLAGAATRFTDHPLGPFLYRTAWRAALSSRWPLSMTLRRADFMYRQSDAADAPRPSGAAGATYAPSRAMPSKVGWEDIAVWDAEVQSAVARRMHDVTVAVVGMDTGARVVPHGNAAPVTDVMPRR